MNKASRGIDPRRQVTYKEIGYYIKRDWPVSVLDAMNKASRGIDPRRHVTYKEIGYYIKRDWPVGV